MNKRYVPSVPKTRESFMTGRLAQWLEHRTFMRETRVQIPIWPSTGTPRKKRIFWALQFHWHRSETRLESKSPLVASIMNIVLKLQNRLNYRNSAFKFSFLPVKTSPCKLPLGARPSHIVPSKGWGTLISINNYKSLYLLPISTMYK